MNQCAQCKASYKPCKSASGCPKCAPNTVISEEEFIEPIEEIEYCPVCNEEWSGTSCGAEYCGWIVNAG